MNTFRFRRKSADTVCSAVFSTMLIASCAGFFSCSTGKVAPTREGLEGIRSPAAVQLPTVNKTTVTLSSDELSGGSVLIVSAKSSEPLDQNGTRAVLGGMQAPFFRNERKGRGFYQAVLAVPYGQEPGELKVGILEKDALQASQELPVRIVPLVHRAEHIRVSRKYTSRRQRRVASRRAHGVIGNQAFTEVTAHKFWDGSFQFPLDSKVTSPFGTSRIFNGTMKTFHGGVDLQAPVGTPVSAAANGVVVLARRIFGMGNTVVINHGYGIFTLYAHLSRFKVKVGTEVSKDSVIGLSGKTGRVKGPHLHWETWIQGVKVNSVELIDRMG